MSTIVNNLKTLAPSTTEPNPPPPIGVNLIVKKDDAVDGILLLLTSDPKTKDSEDKLIITVGLKNDNSTTKAKITHVRVRPAYLFGTLLGDHTAVEFVKVNLSSTVNSKVSMPKVSAGYETPSFDLIRNGLIAPQTETSTQRQRVQPPSSPGFSDDDDDKEKNSSIKAAGARRTLEDSSQGPSSDAVEKKLV